MESDEDWTLMCPDACRGLSDCYGEKFNELYISYERKNMGTKTMKARDIWFKMLDSQIETGTPYMLYKDACNKKSINKIWAQSNQVIYVAKSWNIPVLQRPLCAILQA